MNSDVTKKINFLICGHAQSGKTSFAEAILFKCGATTRLGSVQDESSICDYEEDEKERKSSINLAVLNAKYKEFNLQFVDTPGYLDFIGEVISGVSAVDFAIIVVDAVEGVGVGTEKVWDLLRKEKVPCLFFVNKLDKENADYKKTLDDIKQSLTKKVVSLEVVEGTNVTRILKDKNKDVSLYNSLIEVVAENEDNLLEEFLETGSIKDEEIKPNLKKEIANSLVYPVVGGVAIKEKGIDELLEVIIGVMPSVGESLSRKAKDKSGEEILVEAKVDAPFVAQVFKTIIDPFVGQLTIFRVFSGKIESHSEFFNTNKETKEKFGQLYILQGKQQISQDSVCAGDIAAVSKLKETKTQDTICSSSRVLEFSPLNFPSPAYSASVKPKTRQDEDKISSALNRLTREDCTCNVSIDSQTKEHIISGMGELHLHVIIERMKRKYNAEVALGTPKVPYLETLSKSVTVSHKYKKQSGGKGQYGDVSLEVQPLERGKKFEFVDKIKGGAIPRNFIPSVEKGLINSMKEGFLAGYPIVDIKVILFDGSYHPVDSSDRAFQIAASMALKKAFDQGGSQLLEPIMNVEIVAPSDVMGQITGDISGRRGRVLGMESKGKNEIVKANVPLAEMFKYASDLRSATAGRGNYTMSFSHYEVVPGRITQDIVAKAREEKEEMHV